MQGTRKALGLSLGGLVFPILTNEARGRAVARLVEIDRAHGTTGSSTPAAEGSDVTLEALGGGIVRRVGSWVAGQAKR